MLRVDKEREIFQVDPFPFYQKDMTIYVNRQVLQITALARFLEAMGKSENQQLIWLKRLQWDSNPKI